MMARQRLRLIAAIIVLIPLLGAVLWTQQCRRKLSDTPPETFMPQQAVGSIIAEETSRLLNGHGKVVIVGFDPKAGFPGQRDFALEAFREFASAAGLTIVATEWVVYGPDILHGKPALSTQRLQQLIAEHRQADAIISFVGGPLLTNEEASQLPQQRPRLICVSADSASANAFDLAVVPRQSSIPSESVPASSREWFDRYFQIVQRSP